MERQSQRVPNIEELFEQAKHDLSYDIKDADEFATKLPLLKRKWAMYLIQYELQLKALEQTASAVYKDKFHFYLHENNVIIDRRDVDVYINGDEEYQKQTAILEVKKSAIGFIKEVLKILDNTSYTLGQAIKLYLWKQGM